MKNSVWSMSNLCRGKNPPIKIEKVKPFLPIINDLIHTCKNDQSASDVLIDACWTLSYMTDGSNEKIQTVLEYLNVKSIIDLLESTNDKIVIPALKTVGNIATGDDQQTQTIIQNGVLKNLYNLTYHSKKEIRKETFWTLSNITAGNEAQIQVHLIN
jgi:importin subunit alpha-1